MHAKFEAWCKKKRSHPNVRLGQDFCNQFIKEPWPELFYCEDEEKAKGMIMEWLTRLHYYVTMPPKIKR